ncbi:hypothetical protein KSS87_008517 [Heliosperma pusillum]|nr:hypothetical protein KSS87_008517 [Heliosperma pusillum]
MPGIVGGQRNDDNQMISNAATSYYSPSSNNIENGSVCRPSNGFWSKHRDDINLNQLHKFWTELSPHARQDLLRIDKQTLFEQARKNMYCSRCNGLLLEGFMQIVMYGKSLQHEGGGGKLSGQRLGNSKDQTHGGRSITALCQDETQDPSVHPWGGLITTRDGTLTLLDSYLYAKSLKGLQNVFDSARARERERELLYPDACGGGGRGWISQGIPGYGRGHGTRETCALHTARLSCDTLVDFWSALGEETRQSLLKMKEEDFIERLMYRFDSKRFCRDCRRNVIREFKELKELKRMRRETRCTNWFCVADTAFQYEVTNDTIYADWHQAFADSIGAYHHFEWAVGSGEGKSDILEFENVGMNGSVQVNGLDLGDLTACYITLRAWKLDGRCSEFSVKAHALKGRHCVHCRLVVGDGYVTIAHGESIRRFFEHAEEAEEEEDDDSMDKDGSDFDAECSRPQKHAKSPELAREFLLDAATVEKAFREGTARQNAHSIFVCLALKLLEERIHVACKEIITLEKQMKLLEEEEKEKREEEERKERKRTKEREKKLRRKERLREKEKDKKGSDTSESPLPCDVLEEISTSCLDENAKNCDKISMAETGDTNLSESASPGALNESSSVDYTAPGYLNNASDGPNEEFDDLKDEFTPDTFKGTRRKWLDRRRSTDNGTVAYKAEPRSHEEFSENLSKEVNSSKLSTRNNGLRFGQKVQSCGCSQQNEYRAKVEPHFSVGKFHRETRSATKLEPSSDLPKPIHRVNKFNHAEYTRDYCGRPRSKISNYSTALGRDSPYTKKVWEPVEPQKRYPRSNSDSDVTLKSGSLKTEEICTDKSTAEVRSGQISEELHGDSQGDSSLSSSSSDNSSSCLSEGDSNTPSNHTNLETSSTSDSEDSSQQSEERQGSVCVQNGLPEDSHTTRVSSPFSLNVGSHVSGNTSTKPFTENGKITAGELPSIHNQNMPFPVYHGPSTVSYYHQSPVTWSTSPANGLMTYPHPNHYLLPSPFGYGLNGESPFCMQYGPVQHLSSPFMNSNTIPVYQPIQRTNCLNPLDETSVYKANGVKDPLGESRREYVVPAGNKQTEVLSKEGTERANLSKLEAGNKGFSLFQFGGPVALPTYSSDKLSSDDGKGALYSCCRVEGDHVCSKNETRVEEYNLFAARNELQFSIF